MKKHFLLITALSLFPLTPVMGGDLNSSLETLADAFQNLIPHLSAGEDVKPAEPVEPDRPDEPEKPSEPEVQPVAPEKIVSAAELTSRITPDLKDFTEIKAKIGSAKIAINEAPAFRFQVLMRTGVWLEDEELLEVTDLVVGPEEPSKPELPVTLLEMPKIRAMFKSAMAYQPSFDKAMGILRGGNVRVKEEDRSKLQDELSRIKCEESGETLSDEDWTTLLTEFVVGVKPTQILSAQEIDQLVKQAIIAGQIPIAEASGSTKLMKVLAIIEKERINFHPSDKASIMAILSGLLKLDPNEVQDMDKKLDKFIDDTLPPKIVPSAPKRFFGVPIAEILDQLEKDGDKYRSVDEAIISIQQQGGELPLGSINRNQIRQEIAKRLVAE